MKQLIPENIVATHRFKRKFKLTPLEIKTFYNLIFLKNLWKKILE